MSAVQAAPTWADLYMACLTLDHDGDVVAVNVDQWHALDEIRVTLGDPFPMEAALLMRHRGNVSAWLYRGVYRLCGEELNRLLACDIAERVLPIFEAAHPDDNRPREAIRVARSYVAGEATEEEMAAAHDAAHASVTDAASFPFAAVYAARAAAYVSADHASVAAAAHSAHASAANVAHVSDDESERRWQTERAALYVAGVLP